MGSWRRRKEWRNLAQGDLNSSKVWRSIPGSRSSLSNKIKGREYRIGAQDSKTSSKPHDLVDMTISGHRQDNPQNLRHETSACV